MHYGLSTGSRKTVSSNLLENLSVRTFWIPHSEDTGVPPLKFGADPGDHFEVTSCAYDNF